ncbi:MAG: 2'-5' RNA ligase family protein [Betaproteobacteria bacterium]|nr:2'-5' RNA ligase family protein [Betaproteobacteria bacterium]
MKRIAIRKLVKPPRWGIVWFPEFSAQTAQAIVNIRQSFDPLAGVLPPHLWLVFPFAAHLNATQLTAHIRRRTARWPQVPVVFSGIRNLKDEFVLLNARTGAASLVALHDRLYGGILAPYRRDDMDYLPHITLARSADPRLSTVRGTVDGPNDGSRRDSAGVSNDSRTIFATALEMAEHTLSGEYRARLGHVSLLSLGGEGVHLSPHHRVTEVARIALG